MAKQDLFQWVRDDIDKLLEANGYKKIEEMSETQQHNLASHLLGYCNASELSIDDIEGVF